MENKVVEFTRKKPDNDPISKNMREFLVGQEKESKIRAIIDGAREVGLDNFTQEDAIKALEQSMDLPEESDQKHA